MRLFILWLWLVVNPLWAQIYKWTDNQDVTHWSDSPHKGAENINLSTITAIQVYSAPVTAEKKNTNLKPDTKYSTYEVAIIKPKNEATIRNNQGELIIFAQVKPQLKTGDKLQLIYDGNIIRNPQTKPIFSLIGIERGTHHLTIQVVDKNGKILSTSKPNIFFMHRPRKVMRIR